MSESTRNAEFGDTGAGEAAAVENQGRQVNDELVSQLNFGYRCPPDAGPAWRAAHEAGVDMGLVEDALRMTPAERLRCHQRALNLVLGVIKARGLHDSGNRKPS